MLPPTLLDWVLSPPSSLKILRLMCLEPRSESSGRGLARRAGVSSPQAAAALARLEAVGLVCRRVVGRSSAWKLVPDHALVPVLQELFRAERGLPDDLLKELRESLVRVGVRKAAIFGSVARKESTLDSDLDLFIEVPSEREVSRVQDALLDLRIHFLTKYATMLNPLVYSSKRAGSPPNAHLMLNIRRDAVPLVTGEA